MTILNTYKDISSLWLGYKDAIRNYIFKIVKDEDTANSLAHEVLMKVYSSCCSGREIKNARSWLFQIAYNTCMDHLKQENKKRDLITEGFAEEEDLVYKRAGDFIEPLIDLLPEEYSKPLHLSDIKGMKQSKVAEDLGLSLSATKSRIQRGRNLLKDKILECVHIEVDQLGNLTEFNIKHNCTPLKEN